MTVYRLPIPSKTAYFSEDVSMTGVTYQITFEWNTRIEAWYFSISTQDGQPILVGQKILPSVDLTSRHKDTRLPDGSIVCFSTDDSRRPGREDLGSYINLYFLENDDVSV